MSETRMDESSLEFRMRAEQCRCAYQNGVTCACLAHIPMQDFRSLVSLAFRATPPAAETGERDFAQAERVAHVLAMGAEGLPPQDYRRIGVAYLALRAEVAALREDKARLEDALEEIRDSDDPRWYDLAARALTRPQPEPR